MSWKFLLEYWTKPCTSEHKSTLTRLTFEKYIYNHNNIQFGLLFHAKPPKTTLPLTGVSLKIFLVAGKKSAKALPKA